MNTRMLTPDDAAWEQVAALLLRDHGRRLTDFRAGPGRGTRVLGAFHEGDEGDALVGFGLFQDYRDPELHVGSALDAGQVEDLLAYDEVALYQIALLHADADQASLKDVAAALVRGFEAWLEERYERRALFITLLEQGNREALPLYRSLGFRSLGKPAIMMSLDLPHMRRLLRRVPPLPEGLRPCFFDEATERDLWDAERGFVRCYAESFLSGGESAALGIADALREVLDGPLFSHPMSLLLLDPAEQRVVAFMLAEQPEPDRVHVNAAGVLPDCRGQRLPQRATHALLPRFEAAGVERASFVTSRSRVVRLTLRAFGAHEMDRLQTYYSIG